MPRAALLSLHARVGGIGPDVLAEPALVQVWGPRFNVYAVAADDAPIFTSSRMPHRGPRVDRALETIERLEGLLGDSRMDCREAGKALGDHPNSLRYGTLTGRLRIEWDGARQPTIWLVDAPEIEPAEARRELARRHLHVMGPSTHQAFADWAGIEPAIASTVFEDLRPELVSVVTPIGEAWMLASDEADVRAAPAPPAPARLLPSGDAFWLCWGDERSLLVPHAAHRDLLWTPRVWPGALLVDGDVAGVWRRSKGKVTIEPWRRLTAAERTAVEAEAESFPLPESDLPVTVEWG